MNEEEGVLRRQLVSWLGEIDHFSSMGHIGRNNRVYELRAKGRRYCCKRYFRTAVGEQSGRQNAEWLFSEHVYRCVQGRSPEPIKKDEELGISLFEFVEGDAFSNPITDSDVRDAFSFINCINQRETLEGVFPVASDSCFSVSQHLEHVVRRLRCFESIGCEDEISREMRRFVLDELGGCFQTAANQVVDFCGSEGIPLAKEVASTERVLSPSDFGFHNALRKNDGGVVYMDFEYAGWDDPMKCVCDFFSQPDFPPPHSAIEGTLGRFSFLEGRSELVGQLMPLYAVKWACIILNPFLRAVSDRRHFAGNKLPLEKVLLAAKEYFQQCPARALKSWPT